MTTGVKEGATIKCLDDGCDEDVVLIERYHTEDDTERDVIARWEFRDGAWQSTGSFYDKGTHFHLFCAQHSDAAMHRHLPYRNALKNEADMIAHAEYQGERGGAEYDTFWKAAEERTRALEACEETSILEEDDYPAPSGHGHEHKRWGRELPLVLQRVVYPGEAAKAAEEEAREWLSTHGVIVKEDGTVETY